MNENWMAKASWYELLSSCFVNTKQESAAALASGEFADALNEIVQFLALPADKVADAAALLAGYQGASSDEVFHELRGEYTRLFLSGAERPLVQPYAGVWRARQQGRQAFLMVGQESMSIERFMKKCGATRPDGYGGPVDDIGTLLEFLSVLCLRVADAAAAEGAGDAEERRLDYQKFYEEHFWEFSQALAQAVRAETSSPAFEASACLLQLLPEAAL